ncbi:MAG: hypothetical protein JWN86_1488 [Planctomycetota bacterium]|nr:hypothetical protein [Planctomycetota bacterium]
MPGRKTIGRRILGLVLLVHLAPVVGASEPDENLARLRTMTLDERQKLVKNLAEFDALDRDRRDVIRALNRNLADAEPETRTRFLAVLRRYHVFYQNLPAEKRKALDETTDPAKKLDLIVKYRAEPKRSREELRRFADGLQISALSPSRLRELSRQLFVYFNLDPVKDSKERNELARAGDPEKRRVLVRNLIQAKNLRLLVQHEDAEFRQADAKVKKHLDRVENEFLKAEIEKAKRAKRDPSKLVEKVQEEAANRRKAIVNKLDEIQVFHDLDATRVDSANLDRFEVALPGWARESLDALPPEAAKRRLKVLYRLVFPPGEEMPVSKVSEPARPANTRPAPADGSPSPF